MTKKNGLSLFIVLASCLILAGSCSSSKKMKKKCRECPKFSQVEQMPGPASARYDKV